MSLTDEQQQQKDNLATVKLAIDNTFSAQMETARALGVSDDALKAMDNSFKLKGGALGIAQVALATKQEGAAGGIDAAISWGVGTVTGIGSGILFAGAISNPIGIAVIVLGGGLAGSSVYDNTISDTVKSTLNNWFSNDITPKQKQQQFNTIVDGASDEFKQAFEAESGQTLEQIKQQTDFAYFANIPSGGDEYGGLPEGHQAKNASINTGSIDYKTPTNTDADSGSSNDNGWSSVPDNSDSDFDNGDGSGYNDVTITLNNVNLSLDELSSANALIVL